MKILFFCLIWLLELVISNYSRLQLKILKSYVPKKCKQCNSLSKWRLYFDTYELNSDYGFNHIFQNNHSSPVTRHPKGLEIFNWLLGRSIYTHGKRFPMCTRRKWSITQHKSHRQHMKLMRAMKITCNKFCYNYFAITLKTGEFEECEYSYHFYLHFLAGGET